MVSTTYVHLADAKGLPNISRYRPFKAGVIVERPLPKDQIGIVSDWLVASGCLYMCAWGLECRMWDDMVDWADLEINGSVREGTDDTLVMTTWHEDVTLEEMFFFLKFNAFHPTKTLEDQLLIHVSKTPAKDTMLSLFRDVHCKCF